MFSRFRRGKQSTKEGASDGLQDFGDAMPTPAPDAGTLGSPQRDSAIPDTASRATTGSASKIRAAALGEMVSLVIDDPHYAHLSLKELGKRLYPALGLGQFSIAYIRSGEHGEAKPIAAVLWAHVSDELDAAISANPGEYIDLSASDWNSGSNLWVLEVIGSSDAAQNILARLVQTQFKGRLPRIRLRDRDGRPAVAFLQMAS